MDRTLQDIYEGLSGEELAAIIRMPSEYSPQAVRAAEAELSARGELEEVLARMPKESDEETSGGGGMSDKQIRRAIRWGFGTAFVTGSIAAAVGFIQLKDADWSIFTYNPQLVILALADPLIRFALGYGIYKRSPIAAIAFLGYMVVLTIYLIMIGGSIPSPTGFLVFYGAYQGVRGTRAYSKQQEVSDVDEWFEVVR